MNRGKGRQVYCAGCVWMWFVDPSVKRVGGVAYKE